MPIKPCRWLVPWLRRFHHDGNGQDILEWTIGLPVFLVLCAAIVFYGWSWWNQVTAAAAIHDGVYLSAKSGGDVGRGYAQTQSILKGAVGNVANRYDIGFANLSGQRSVYGYVENHQVITLPFVGAIPFSIRASSFQRKEGFYGGDPGGWW
jgi:hypothetical protein